MLRVGAFRGQGHPSIEMLLTDVKFFGRREESGGDQVIRSGDSDPEAPATSGLESHQRRRGGD